MVATQITLGCAVFTGLRGSGGGGIVAPTAFLSVLQKHFVLQPQHITTAFPRY